MFKTNSEANKLMLPIIKGTYERIAREKKRESEAKMLYNLKQRITLKSDLFKA